MYRLRPSSAAIDLDGRRPFGDEWSEAAYVRNKPPSASRAPRGTAE